MNNMMNVLVVLVLDIGAIQRFSVTRGRVRRS